MRDQKPAPRTADETPEKVEREAPEEIETRRAGRRPRATAAPQSDAAVLEAFAAPFKDTPDKEIEAQVAAAIRAARRKRREDTAATP